MSGCCGLVGHPEGGSYRFGRRRRGPERPLTYALVEVDVRGRRQTHGPYTVSLSEGRVSTGTPSPSDAAHQPFAKAFGETAVGIEPQPRFRRG